MELIIFGGYIFWGVIAFLFIVEILTAAFEVYRYSAGVLVLGLFTLFILSGPGNWINLIYQHPQVLFIGFIGYFILGTTWSIFKWFLYTAKVARKYEEIKCRFYESNNLDINIPISQLPNNDRDRFVNLIANEYPSLYIHNFKSIGKIIPKANENKTRIISWIFWWPFSIISTIFNDLLLEICEFIYNFISTILQTISNKQFSKYNRDWE